ncbi:MAG TPA: DUF1080 domain-containing protein [Candidatus Hydrogenedentes bacterium]|nr:DUF1080 domain-containing protein [Candidatus Hydrogenedentota bacterium]HNT86941.1 DUF1080 domain-containing protein [Candidatus Hydrogenedentota bacterium]
MRIVLTMLAATALVAGLGGCGRAGGATAFDEWADLFNGEDLAGWHISQTNGHGDTKNWRVVEGAIEGAQDAPGNGGIIVTDRDFGDFLLELELNPDWGLDSGIFLRSTESGKCYQIMVDYYDGGCVGGVYGEGIGGFRADAVDWLTHYRKGEWNKVLALVMGNPPIIEVWLNGAHALSWKGSEKLLDDRGRIGLQVHAGANYYEKKTRFRNIRIRELP